MPRDLSAGIIIIGNEILSGKVADTNAPFLTRELRALGVDLKRILTIPDELDEIAAAVREFGPRYDVVFTSGGVGPTHDDVTMEGIARGLGRPVIRHPIIESRLREFYKEHVNDARLKMSEVPEGAELLVDGRLGFPTVKVENFYILPGIPELFEQKFETLKERFDATPYTLRVVYSAGGRGDDRRASQRHPDRVPGAAARVVPEDQPSRVRREAHPRIEGPGLRRPGPGAPPATAAGRGGSPYRVAPSGRFR